MCVCEKLRGEGAVLLHRDLYSTASLQGRLFGFSFSAVPPPSPAPYLSLDPTFLVPFTPYNTDVPAIQLPPQGAIGWGKNNKKAGAERAYLGGRMPSSRERVPTSVQRNPLDPSEPLGAGDPVRRAWRKALLALQKLGGRRRQTPAGRRALRGSR